MNLEEIKTLATQKLSRGGLYLQKYSPEILLFAGLAGMAATIVMASKATLKAGEIVDEKNTKLELIRSAVDHMTSQSGEPYSQEDALKDKSTVYIQTGLKFAKLYAPAISMGVMSVAAILSSHGIMADRQVALIGAYGMAVEALKNYRQRVVEDLGEDVDKDYYLGLKDEKFTEIGTDEEGKKTKVKKTRKVSAGQNQHSIYSRFFDESNPMWRTDRILNKAFLQHQQNYVNDLLTIQGHVMLNEVYERLGFPHTKQGAIVGWFLKDPKTMKEEGRDGYIDFGLYDVSNDPARQFINETNPTILLDFNPDGIIFDLLEG